MTDPPPIDLRNLLPSRQPAGDAAAGERLAQALELVSGQKLSATVLELLDRERILIGLLGGRLEARTQAPLEVGRSYEFTVVATSPRLTLAVEKPIVLPAAGPLAAAGLLGVGGKELGRDLQRLAKALAGSGPAQVAAGVLDWLGGWSGAPGAAPPPATLRQLHERLGHDQELRVLRLAAHPHGESVAATELVQSGKAVALAAAGDEQAPAAVRAAGRALADNLSRAELDNVRRAEQGAPLWLPLPVVEGGALREARLFVRAEDAPEESGTEAEGRGFAVVLLLEFTRLGALRVDIGVRERRVRVQIQTVTESALRALEGALAELEAELTACGLESPQVLLRRAPGAALPVADLIAVPRDPRALVDVHA